MSRPSTRSKPRRKASVDIDEAEVRDGPANYTGSGAFGRVLFIDAGWVKFGTDGKSGLGNPPALDAGGCPNM